MKYIITESQYKLIMEDGLDIEPSHTAVKNICDSKKFCSAQGKITFGQLRALVDSAKKERLWKGVGEGGFKAMIRLLPWFLPQVAIAGFVGSSIRALNKILRPTITETDTYKKWWGKAVMKSFDLAEGELPIDDPLSKIFFISDGLMTMMDDKYKLKFANHISNIATSMPDDEEVPDFFVENELRNWVNNKFLLDPPLPPKISKEDSLPNTDDEETITEEKNSKEELFQDLINNQLEYIKKGCNDISWDGFPNDISFSSCDEIDSIDSIKVVEVRPVSGSRTDMYGKMYDTQTSIYIKIIINYSSAGPMSFDETIWDVKNQLKKSTGGLPIVLDYEKSNSFKD